MKDEDEVLLWPTRFDRNSTNPWDHDDFGNGEGIANPLDSNTGPDAIDEDDDNDTRADLDFNHSGRNVHQQLSHATTAPRNQRLGFSDNDCKLDA